MKCYRVSSLQGGWISVPLCGGESSEVLSAIVWHRRFSRHLSLCKQSIVAFFSRHPSNPSNDLEVQPNTNPCIPVLHLPANEWKTVSDQDLLLQMHLARPAGTAYGC